MILLQYDAEKHMSKLYANPGFQENDLFKFGKNSKPIHSSGRRRHS